MIYYSTQMVGASLSHHGIKDQKWGVRRFQNEDGSLTSAGKNRYSNKVTNREIKTDRETFKNSIRNEIEQKYKIRDIQNQLDSFYDKHPNVDGDDGGGGTHKEYLEWERLNTEYEKRQMNVDHEIGKRTSEYLIEKYGKQRIDSYNTSENIKAGIGVVGALFATGAILATAPVSIPLLAVGIVGYSAIEEKKRNKANKNG